MTERNYLAHRIRGENRKNEVSDIIKNVGIATTEDVASTLDISKNCARKWMRRLKEDGRIEIDEVGLGGRKYYKSNE